MVDDEEVYAYLEHFGVKGMHWGIRNEKKRTARRNANAKKFEDKAAKIQRKIDSRRPGAAGNRALRENQKQALDNAKRKREGKLSSGQKKAVIGASAAAAIIASYVGYQALQSGNGRRLIGKGKDFIKGNHGVPFKVNPELRDPNMDADEIFHKVVRQVNPDYGAVGTKMNCRRATYAYEMRRRGFDVAATRSTSGRGQDITGNFNVLNPGVNLVPAGAPGVFTRLISENRKPGGAKPFTELVKTKTQGMGEFMFPREAVHSGGVVKALQGMPNGARGELGVEWASGGLHSVAWEKIKGEVVVFDTQVGKRYQGLELDVFMKRLNRAGVTRLDNKPLNADFLRRWIRDSDGSAQAAKNVQEQVNTILTDPRFAEAMDSIRRLQPR